MTTSLKGSVRVDLVGGTLDIPPLNLVIPNVVTLNVATSLQAEVEVSSYREGKVLISSMDYGVEKEFSTNQFLGEINEEIFGPLVFVATILSQFNLKNGLKIKLSSGSPPGAGLGGSSAMGIVLYKAMLKFSSETLKKEEIIKIVGAIESKILKCGPTGYQDYYPAMYGGILALRPNFKGVDIKQLYDTKLSSFLEKNITLVYSGQSRLSGINNWEVFKSFFNKDEKVINGLTTIAQISFAALNAIKLKEFDKLLDLIIEEGQEREKLFPNITTPQMRDLLQTIQQKYSGVGIKICGAGGGGCFLLVHPNVEKTIIQKYVDEAKMKVLPFHILPPEQE